MKIIKASDISIPQITAVLKDGGVIVYPTETTYGLGCRMTDEKAVQRIFDIKKRQQHKSVLVVASDVAMIRTYVMWNPIIEQLAESYWPGPLTIVGFKKVDTVLPEGIVGPEDTIAFRVTSHPLAAQLAHDLGEPLVSTSANISSMESPYDIADVVAMFQDEVHQPDMIIDGGVLPYRPPSTIVRVCDGDIEVLRQGEIVINE